MLDRRLRRRPNIKSALFQRIVFEGSRLPHTVDLVIFERFYFLRILRGQIRELKNLAKIIIMIAL